jgi:hypothetical protein
MSSVTITLEVTVEQAAAMVLALKDLTPIQLVIDRPVFMKGNEMANVEVPMGKTGYMAIFTTNKEGMKVAAPTGDMFTAMSTDTAVLMATIGVMPPSAPNAGAVALVVKSVSAGNATAKLTDSAGLTEDDVICDVVADLTPAAIAVDEPGIFFLPN